MSRIGKQPVTIPAGVKVAVAGNVVSVEGPKGKLTKPFPKEIGVTVANNINRQRESDIRAQANRGTQADRSARAVDRRVRGARRDRRADRVGFMDQVIESEDGAVACIHINDLPADGLRLCREGVEPSGSR